MRLSELKTGERAVIVKVNGHGGFRKRIIEMGFVRGNKVKVILNAPLRDPIEYEIIGYKISLRRAEAAKIEVISESEAKELLSKRESVPALESEVLCSERSLSHPDIPLRIHIRLPSFVNSAISFKEIFLKIVQYNLPRNCFKS